MPNIKHDSTLNYQTAGVDINKAEHVVDDIKHLAKQTHRPEVLTSIGGFGGLFELPLNRYQHPVLVSGTDGVGTKLKLATAMQRHDTIGIDLVAMCVNDIITLGAEPLFFLDYFATGHLNPEQAKAILTGIVDGCRQAKMALIGGETAELPGMYQGDDYDLAGFCVGIVEKDNILSADRVKEGDALIAIGSSGAHSNGYSLIRKILDHVKADYNTPFGKSTLGDELLTPTKIYTQAMQALQKEDIPIHAAAHITGGGILQNLPRVLPLHHKAVINENSWQWPEIFQWLQKNGNIETREMYHTFNVGVGMILVAPADQVESILKILHNENETAWLIGTVEAQSEATATVEINESK